MAPEIDALLRALDDAETDASRLAAGLTERQGQWRPAPGAWSIAECLDHLATANEVYLAAMQPAAERALSKRRHRRRPARPGFIGGWFVRALEPPVKKALRGKAPRSIQPRPSPALGESLQAFRRSQQRVREFVARFESIDLAGVRFVNPFVTGVRFSLATGLHVIAAHERRHLWQAHRVLERLGGPDVTNQPS